MYGCDRISEYIHTTINMEVLIETLKVLISDLHWCSCNVFYTQDHTVADITND